MKKILLIGLVIVLSIGLIGCSDDEPEVYNLEVEVVEGEGEIELEPEKNEYDEGEEVKIEAIPEDDYEFIEWVGNLEGDKNPTILTIEENMTIGAEFDKKTVELDISIEGEGELKVEPEKDKYPINDIVDFKAIPDEGYQFYRIKGLFSSPMSSSEISNKLSRRVRRDKEIEVEFLPSNVTIPGSKLEFDDISFGGNRGITSHHSSWDEIQTVEKRIGLNDITGAKHNDKPLDGEYLLSFSAPIKRYFGPTTKIPFEKIIVFENGELKNNQDIKVINEIEREEPASVYFRDIDISNLTIKFEEKTTN